MTPTNEEIESLIAGYGEAKTQAERHFLAGLRKGAMWARDQQPKFKTLEDYGWNTAGAYSYGGSTTIAVNIPFGFYEVTSWIDGTFTWRYLDMGNKKPCDSIDQGKQLAQADYERRINELKE